MFEIQICPIKKLYDIATQADLSNVAAILVSSYDIDESKLEGCYKFSAHYFQDITSANSNDAFNLSIAKEIKDFILSLPNDLDTLICCCDSGESRSSAMAAAILKFYGQDDIKIWKNPKYHPNTLVYKTLCQAFDIYVSDIELISLVHVNNQAFRKAIKGE